MTATVFLTVINADITAIYPLYTGTGLFDLGIATTETDKVGTGLEIISQTLGTSAEAYAFNILGQKRTITVNLKQTGTRTELRDFTKNLKILCDYQLQQGVNTTATYWNTNSIVNDFAGGTKIMIFSYSINSSNRNSPSEVNYTITMVETVGIPGGT